MPLMASSAASALRCDIALVENCPGPMLHAFAAEDPRPLQTCATAHAASLRSTMRAVDKLCRPTEIH
jgi:hypothetical protein